MSGLIQNRRVLSGMRPTGQLHLGNYHGALKNWIELQYQYECFFFIADWHALTTGYDDTSKLEEYVWTMAIDWLAAGLNPGVATLFIQSRVPEHAELHLLLSMITPLGWLERVPSFKDQQAQLADWDLATYGFLGYPLLQSADIVVISLVIRRRRLWDQPRSLRLRGLLAGALSLLAYGLVLWAQTRGQLAPIAALRETSVIFGAIIGAVFFKEPFGRRRVIAAVIVAAGILLIAG